MSHGETKRVIKVLIAKPGLDGHDVGAKLVCRALMEAGMDVTYSGLRQSPAQIAAAAKLAEVDVVGLSILSGAHLPICERVKAALAEVGLTDVVWIVGGNIPRHDRDALTELGVDAVFATATPFSDIVEFLEQRVNA